MIMSMRSISAVDWADLFESMSLVDSVLRAEVDYAQSNFSTRNRCRHAIEELARGSRHTELDIAECAMQVAGTGGTRRERNPGYYLIAGGRRGFENRLGYRPALRARFTRLIARMGIHGYIAGVALLALVTLAWPLSGLLSGGIGALTLAVLGVSGLVLAVDAAMAVANNSITSRFGARTAPRNGTRGGNPRDLRTLVVVPVILTTREAIAEHVEHLEIHHLASLDGDVSFALLVGLGRCGVRTGRRGRGAARACGRGHPRA